MLFSGLTNKADAETPRTHRIAYKCAKIQGKEHLFEVFSAYETYMHSMCRSQCTWRA